MIEIAAIDERQEDKERSMLKETLKKQRREKNWITRPQALFEEMQQNLEEAHARSSETEQILDGRRRRRSVIKVPLHSNQQMETMMSFLAEWFSLGEMKVMQGVSVLMSVRVSEWQYKDILNDIDDLMWEDSSDDGQK